MKVKIFDGDKWETECVKLVEAQADHIKIQRKSGQIQTIKRKSAEQTMEQIAKLEQSYPRKKWRYDSN